MALDNSLHIPYVAFLQEYYFILYMFFFKMNIILNILMRAIIPYVA